MVVGEIPEAVDMLVVGGGPGGYAAALAAAQAGRRVVLVDAKGTAGLGGVCVSVGCIPSKALIELADRVHQAPAWQARGAGRAPTGPVDLGAFQTWKEQVTTGLSSGVDGLLRAAGVDVRPGYFRFTRPAQGALVSGPEAPPTHLRFASCVVATGSRPMALSHLPFDHHRVLDSTGALALTELPASLAVVGGGYIGVELGTAYAKLGVRVSIIEAQERLLPTLPPSVGRAVAKRLAELGVEVRTGAVVEGDNGTHLIVSIGDDSHRLAVDKVVVAVGRVPNTDDLGLDALGIEPGPRGLLAPTPDRLIAPNVAAIGDITAGPALAHKATAEAHVAVEALGGHAAVFDPTCIPAVVFSDPEIAQTGISADDAEETGLLLSRAEFPVAASGRARTLGESLGSLEWTYDADGIVRGALVVGPHASELVAEATLAVEMGAHLEDVAGTIHAHPTLAEMSHEAALVALGRPLHVPRR